MLIQVEAAGVNRPDVMQRRGQYPPPPGASDIPGLEVAGTIVRIGPSVTRWAYGRSCVRLVAGGGYADIALRRRRSVFLSRRISTLVLARQRSPNVLHGVDQCVSAGALLEPGERLAPVHGGTSGIGTTAIQLARALESIVDATAGTEAKCAACRRLGAAAAINYRETDFVQAVHRVTNDSGVDVVLDIMGGDDFPRNLECLAMDGRLVQIGLLGGARSAVDLRRVMQRRLTITGSTLRTRTVEEKGRSRARSKRTFGRFSVAGGSPRLSTGRFL